MICRFLIEKFGAGLFCIVLPGDSPVTEGQIVNDSVLYIAKMQQLANHDRSELWPVKTVVPREGAILPFKRIVAYYGNFYCEQMGVLGQDTRERVIEKLKDEVRLWEKADTFTPVVPAIHSGGTIQ